MEPQLTSRTTDPGDEVKDYEEGLVNGIKSAWLPHLSDVFTPKIENSSHFQRGFTKGQKTGTDLMEDMSKEPVVMETKHGIPVELTEPISCDLLERQSLTNEIHCLTKREYFRNGYALYLTWFLGKLHEAGLSRTWDAYAVYSLTKDLYNICQTAHSICIFDPQEFEKILPSDIDQMMFLKIIRDIPDEFLRNHSGRLWRGTEGILVKSAPTCISLNDLENGRESPPACGFHMGIAMLEANGYLDLNKSGEHVPTTKFIIQD